MYTLTIHLHTNILMRYICIIFLLLLINISCKTQAIPTKGYDLSITIKPYQNKTVYMGYYYGNKKGILDSLHLDGKGKGHFRGEKLLPHGVYFIVSPQKIILLEFLIDREQQFGIEADTVGLNKNVVFTNSPNNKLFRDYTTHMYGTVQKIKAIEQRIEKVPNDTYQKADFQKQLDAYNQQIEQYRETIIKKDSSSLLALIFRTMREPTVSKAYTSKLLTKLDSFYYYKKHYWDDVVFWDARLVRTPVFESKWDRYFAQFVSPAADSINKELDRMLLMAQVDSTMYRFLVSKCIDQYMSPSIMGQDAVFVHLFEKHIATGKVNWLTEEQHKYVYNRAYSLMANLIGQQGSNMRLADTTDHIISLYDVKAPYTLICFWDPACGHCQQLMPKLDSIYNAKWKSIGLKVFAVMIESGKEPWMKYIRNNHLQDWIHVYHTEALQAQDRKSKQPSYRQLYDAYATPTLILLDADKHIIAKHLTYQQIDDFLTYRMRNNK